MGDAASETNRGGAAAGAAERRTFDPFRWVTVSEITRNARTGSARPLRRSSPRSEYPPFRPSREVDHALACEDLAGARLAAEPGRQVERAAPIAGLEMNCLPGVEADADREREWGSATVSATNRC